MPQCGFSRASIQILGLQGVDPQKFSAFNVLEDEELRAGKIETKLIQAWTEAYNLERNQRVLGVAYDTPALRRQGICGRFGYHDVYAPGWLVGKDAGGEGCSCAGRGRRVEFIKRLELYMLFHACPFAK